MKKKLIASVASIALFFTTAFCGLSVPVYAAQTGGTPDIPGPVNDQPTFYRDSETGHIYTDDISAGTDSGQSSVSPSRAYIPSSYPTMSELRSRYPNTRSQSPYGNCWTFAATAAAEFDMINDGDRTKNGTDFSEWQLAWFNYHTANDLLGGLDDDQINTSGSLQVVISKDKTITVPKYISVGGSFFYSMHTLAQWKTFTTESALPYSTVVNNPYASVDTKYAYSNDQARLTNVRYLDIMKDPASVKQAILDNGAVYITYCHDSKYYAEDGSGRGLYFNPYDQDTNHDVVIVGWDDSVNRYTFPPGMRPPANGAWIVRNSWSTDPSAYPEYTYFYMSYYDASLADIAFSTDYSPSSKYNYLYQHDGSTTHASYPARSIANVFTAKGPSGTVSESLKAVMIPFTAATNVNYKIEIYSGWKDADNPGYLNSGATTTGWTGSKGIYTIDLATPVPLAPGEKYAVVVTALNGPVNFDIESSASVTYLNEKEEKVSWFDTVASLDKGESFMEFNGKLLDVKSFNWEKSGNFCIKAMTNASSSKRYTVTYDLNGGINSTANPSGFMDADSGSITLKNPTRSGYHFLGWYSDSSFKNKVTAIDCNKKAGQTLYARWCSNGNSSKTMVTKRATLDSNGSYKIICNGCGQTKASYTSYKPSSIKLNYTTLGYNGSNKSPKPVITDSNGKLLVYGTDYTYSYNKSSRKNPGKYYVTVKFINKYSGSKQLAFNIMPGAPSSASAKLYGYNDVKVSWNKSSGAAGYYVYYKTSSSSNYKSYKRTTKSSVKFSNLSSNKKYNFKIIPYYKSGSTRVKSTLTKEVSTTTLKKLNKPTIKSTSNGKVSLNWQCISGASGYQVYWSAKKSSGYKKLAQYSNKYIGVTFSVGKNKTYWYKTRAYKTVNGKKIYGPWSTPKSYKRK